MGMFDFLDPAFKALQYPQSVWSGAVGALNHVAPTENLKKRNQGRSALDELERGFAGGLKPSDVDAIDTSNTEGRINASLEDVLLDPLNFLGGIAKTGALGSKLGGLIEAGGTVGKLGEGAGVADKAAQFTRRAYEGYKGSDQDPTNAIMSAPLMGLAESRVLPLVSGKLKKFFPQTKTTQEIEDSIGALVRSGDPQSVASKINTDPLMEQSYQDAARLIDMVPPGREIELATQPLDTSPGLDQLVNNLQNGVPTGRATPQLPVGRPDLPQMPINMGPGNAMELAPKPMFNDIEQLDPRMLSGAMPEQAPLELMAQNQSLRQNGAIPMGGDRPTGAMNPYMSRNPEMSLDPAILRRISGDQGLPTQVMAKQLGPGDSIQGAVGSEAASVEPSIQASLNRIPLNKQAAYWKLKAERGDPTAQAKYLEILDQLEGGAQGSPLESFLQQLIK